MSIEQRILDLKKKHSAVILAHYYEDGEIQDIADFVGDSLALAQFGKASDAKVILMAGVVFMGETAKILSPEKTVLVPDLKAGCSLVDHSPYEQYLEWRHKHPDAICVSYVNSSAKVKSITDITCTSSNAEKILAAIPEDRPVLFGPDRNLGSYLAKKSSRDLILWPGACEVHVLFSARKLFELKTEHPDAIVLAHPECLDEVLQYADVIGSTSKILNEVKTNPAKKFIVATEDGIFHQMRKERPDAELFQAPAEGSCACNQCPYMKLNTLEKIEQALESLAPALDIEDGVAESAQLPLERMLKVTNGESIDWPASFSGPN
ncbi:MAG: quinolinate synthase NadA [Bdellovibrionales bacterium]|nr:quinolinate synthase NadA [Bdellovibrionales bacterium]